MEKEKLPEDEEINKLKNDFFDKIKNHVLENFEPAINLIDPDNVFMSSKEVFNNLQRLFPSECYEIADIALWLDQAGFIFIDMGTMQFEWILKRTR